MTVSMPSLVILERDPLRPAVAREIFTVSQSITVRAWLDEQGIEEFPLPTICLVDGEARLRHEWPLIDISACGEVRFASLPYDGGGGGGGGGGKSPLKVVLSIAIMAVSIVAAGPLAGAMGFTNATAFTAFGEAVSWMSIGKALVGGAISLVGNALTSALLPSTPSQAASTSWGQSSYGSPPAPSPTYALSAQGNQARLGQPIAEHFGRHLRYPDLAAEPYSEYVGNEQFLYQLHVVGMGEYAFETWKFNETPLANFAEVETQLVPPGGTLTLVKPNVVTSPEVSGQELLGPNQLGSGETGWVGFIVSSSSETTANRLGFDVVLPRGLYYANSSGGLDSKTVSWVIEVQKIDDDGAALADPVQIASESITDATNTPIRKSYGYDVTTGRWQARLRRTDNKDLDARAGHELRWSGLRAYLTQAPNFGDVTLFAFKARATDNLSSRASRLLNVVATRKLPTWNPTTGWSADLTATRSIAWAAAYLCRAANGGNLPDSRIALSQLYALDQIWSARGDTCDGVFDTTTTAWEALTRVLRAGRGMPIDELGVVRFIRDQAKTLPTMTFTPRDIVKGSVEITYNTPDEETADDVRLEYWSEKVWRQRHVTGAVSGSSGLKPANRQLPMAVQTAQVQREADFMAADNRYRRIEVSFVTHRGGMLPRYGDPVAVVHPLVDAEANQGGEVLEWDAENDVLTLSEPARFTEGQTHYVALVGANGFQSAAVEAVAIAGQPKQIHVLGDLGMEPYTGGERERTRYVFGPQNKMFTLCLMRGAVPRGNKVALSLVIEDARAHVN